MSGSIPANRGKTAGMSGFIARSWKPCIQPRPIEALGPDVSGPLHAITTKSGRTRRLASARLRASIGLRRGRCQEGFPNLHIRPAAVRQVRSNGEIKWRGDLIHICSALAGEAVGVEETEDGSWQVCFFDVPIGVINRKTRKLRRLGVPLQGNPEPAPKTEPGDP
jgi:hypothetical protein